MNTAPKYSNEQIEQPSTDKIKNDSAQIYHTSQPVTPTDILPPQVRLTITNRGGARAFGCKNSDETFTVFQGSQISANEAPKLSTSAGKAYALRREYKLNGTINDINVFTKDVHFNSISLAAKVILGTSADGSQWRVEKL